SLGALRLAPNRLPTGLAWARRTPLLLRRSALLLVLARGRTWLAGFASLGRLAIPCCLGFLRHFGLLRGFGFLRGFGLLASGRLLGAGGLPSGGLGGRLSR